MAAIKSTLGLVKMSKLLFGPYAFIAKSVNKTTYSDCNTVHTTDCSTVFVQFHCNTVHTTDCSTVFVQFHFHKALNKPFSDHTGLR